MILADVVDKPRTPQISKHVGASVAEINLPAHCLYPVDRFGVLTRTLIFPNGLERGLLSHILRGLDEPIKQIASEGYPKHKHNNKYGDKTRFEDPAQNNQLWQAKANHCHHKC